MTTNNNLTTIRLHVPHHVEEENRTFSETTDDQIWLPDDVTRAI